MSLNNLNMHCISIDANDLKLIKELNYVPVGLGGSDFTDEWIKDNRGINITEKNKWYSELTFHYWFWKNRLNNCDDNSWIGFCQKRRF